MNKVADMQNTVCEKKDEQSKRIEERKKDPLRVQIWNSMIQRSLQPSRRQKKLDEAVNLGNGVKQLDESHQKLLKEDRESGKTGCSGKEQNESQKDHQNDATKREPRGEQTGTRQNVYNPEDDLRKGSDIYHKRRFCRTKRAIKDRDVPNSTKGNSNESAKEIKNLMVTQKAYGSSEGAQAKQMGNMQEDLIQKSRKDRKAKGSAVLKCENSEEQQKAKRSQPQYQDQTETATQQKKNRPQRMRRHHKIKGHDQDLGVEQQKLREKPVVFEEECNNQKQEYEHHDNCGSILQNRNEIRNNSEQVNSSTTVNYQVFGSKRIETENEMFDFESEDIIKEIEEENRRGLEKYYSGMNCKQWSPYWKEGKFDQNMYKGALEDLFAEMGQDKNIMACIRYRAPETYSKMVRKTESNVTQEEVLKTFHASLERQKTVL